MKKEPALIRLPPEDYISLLAAAMAAGSIFFPWFKIDAITSYEGYTSGLSFGVFNGTFVEGGWAGLSLSLFCLVMIYLGVRWSVVAGFSNTLIGLSYLLGWIDLSGKFLPMQTEKGIALLQVNPQPGLYLFTFCSLLCTILIFRKHYASRVF